jgi:hypothetical protein
MIGQSTGSSFTNIERTSDFVILKLGLFDEVLNFNSLPLEAVKLADPQTFQFKVKSNVLLF